MSARVIGLLSQETVSRWRMAALRFKAVEMNPRAYSKDETERIIMEMWAIDAEIEREQDIDVWRSWSVSLKDGSVFYTKDSDD